MTDLIAISFAGFVFATCAIFGAVVHKKEHAVRPDSYTSRVHDREPLRFRPVWRQQAGE